MWMIDPLRNGLYLGYHPRLNSPSIVRKVEDPMKSSNSNDPGQRIAKQERRLILLCIGVAAIMLLAIVRHFLE